MTSLDASTQLYKWFIENDSFCLIEDFIRIVTISNTPERDKAAFRAALKEFEKAEIVSLNVVNNVEYWVLKKAFSSFNQNVPVSPELALTISTIINKFCTITKNTNDICDPLSLEEKDIKNLIFISNLMLQKNIDSGKEEE